MTPVPIAMTETHPLAHLEAVLIIGIAGFAGSNLRYFLDLLIPSTLLATLTVNVLGCVALGFFFYEGLYSGLVSEQSYLVVATGFISSFTTYSTFVVDAVLADPAVAVLYVFGSYVFGFGAVLVGRQGARWLHTRTASEESVDPATVGGEE